MEFVRITHRELSALRGLSHLQQLAYLQGIKPYVDYKTGIVGIRRGISYQSLSEALYIEPHSGIKSGSPSKDQLRRALKGLEKAGIIEIQSWERKLVLRCLLLDKDDFAQNKPAIKAPDYAATDTSSKNLLNAQESNLSITEHHLLQKPEPAIPQDNNNYFFVFLLNSFEEFWNLYPLKKDKEIAFTAFKKLNPTERLIKNIMVSLREQIRHYQQKRSEGVWMPAWKYPMNWLTQRCWENKTTIFETKKEHVNAIDEANSTEQSDVNVDRITKSNESTRFGDSEFQKLWKLH